MVHVRVDIWNINITKISKSLWHWWHLMGVLRASRASHYALIVDEEKSHHSTGHAFTRLCLPCWSHRKLWFDVMWNNFYKNLGVWGIWRGNAKVNASMGKLLSRALNDIPLAEQCEDHFEIPQWLILFSFCSFCRALLVSQQQCLFHTTLHVWRWNPSAQRQ